MVGMKERIQIPFVTDSDKVLIGYVFFKKKDTGQFCPVEKECEAYM